MSEEELIEQLAAQEHRSWANWMSYLFLQCKTRADGSLIIDAAYVKSLQRQIDTPYHSLTEQEKQYDRDEVMSILPIIQNYAKKEKS